MNYRLFFWVYLFSIVGCDLNNEQLIIKGVEMAKENRCAKAIELFTKAIENNPNLQSAYFNRGLCYQELERYGEAYHDFNKILVLKTHSGVVFEINKNIPASDESIRNQIDYNDALFERAVIKYYMDSLRSAYEDFNKLITIKYKERTFCFIYQGLLLIKAGDDSSACLMFKKALLNAKTHEEIREANAMIKEYCAQNHR